MKDKIIIIMMFICIISLIVTNTLMYLEIKNTVQVTDNFEHILKNGSRVGVEGVNMPGYGYFVATRYQNWSNIVDTDTHEQCHELVSEDKEHYCNI